MIRCRWTSRSLCTDSLELSRWQTGVLCQDTPWLGSLLDDRFWLPRRQAGSLGDCRYGSLSAVFAARTLIASIRLGLMKRNQVFFAISDQICTPHILERLAQQWPVVRIVITQESLVQPATTIATNDIHRLTGASDFLERVAP